MVNVMRSEITCLFLVERMLGRKNAGKTAVGDSRLDANKST